MCTRYGLRTQSNKCDSIIFEKATIKNSYISLQLSIERGRKQALEPCMRIYNFGGSFPCLGHGVFRYGTKKKERSLIRVIN